MSFSSLASIQVTYDFLERGNADHLMQHLQRLIRHAHSQFVSVCARLNTPRHILHVNTAEPLAPIIPLLTSHPRSLAGYCQDRGFMVRPIVAPTVPRGKERVRVCLHARNTTAQVEGLAKAIEEWAQIRLKEDSAAVEEQAVVSNLSKL
jgi:8-amino-7-oxononanoate synthase